SPEYRDLLSNIRAARFVLVVLAALYLIAGALPFALQGDAVLPGAVRIAAFVDGGYAILMLGCLALSKWAPATALVGALVAWVLMQLVVAIVWPLSIFSGGLVKLAGIGLLVRGVVAALRVRRAKRRLAAPDRAGAFS